MPLRFSHFREVGRRHHALPSFGKPRKAPKQSTERGPWVRVALLALALQLTLAPLLMGGVFPWSMVWIAIGSLICLVASTLAARATWTGPAPLVAWAALALLGWTALQAAPLPCDLVARLAPDAARNVAVAQKLLGNGGAARCTLSHDPGATAEEIMKGVAIVATLLAAWVVASLGARRDVFWCVAGSTLVVSLVALGHGLARLDSVYGMYKPVYASRTLLLAPLMNPNNLGAFAALGVPLWITLSYRSRHRELRFLGFIATVVTASTALLSLSRGAIAQLIGSVIIVAWCVRTVQASGQSHNKRDRIVRSAGLAIAVALGCGGAVYAAGALLTRELENRDLSKLALIGHAFAFAWDHFWIGVGRGAFSSAFVPVEGRTVRYAYAENFVAQWLSDWGWPLTLAWLGICAVALWRAGRGVSSLTRRGALIAFLALCAQNLVDLGFEILGISVVAAALLGAIIAPAKPTKAAAPRSIDLRAALVLGLTACVIVIATLGPSLEEHSVSELHARLLEQMNGPDRTPFRRTLARSLQLHPAEPVFVVVAATAALRDGDRSAARWINRAMQVAPNWGAPHILAFQWLWALGRQNQALLELKRAAEIDPRPWGQQICQVTRHPGDLALRAAPTVGRRRDYLEIAAQCVPVEHPSAEAIDDALMKEFPERSLAYMREVARLAAQGDVDESLAMISRLLKEMPAEPRFRISRAYILLQANRLPEMLAYAERDLPLLADEQKRSLLPLQASAYAQLRDRDGVRRVIGDYRRLTAGSAEGLAESYALEGRMNQVMNQPGSALAAFREAYSINPNTQYLAEVATLADRLGDRPQRIWAYMTLCEREPRGKFCATRDQLLRPQSAELH
jgi:hypothetical protein